MSRLLQYERRRPHSPWPSDPPFRGRSRTLKFDASSVWTREPSLSFAITAPTALGISDVPALHLLADNISRNFKQMQRDVMSA